MRGTRLLLAVVAGTLAGCRPASTPTLVWEGSGVPHAQSAVTAVAALPTVDPGVRRGPWGDSPDASIHLIAADRPEEPHVHRIHDLTVVLVRGRGTLVVEGRSYVMRAGDVMHVMRGRNHHFHPGGGESAVALAIFTPRLTSPDYEPAVDMRNQGADPHN